MTNLPKDLPARLRKAGLTVIEIDGWQARGRPSSTGGFKPVGVLNHHTGGRDGSGDAEDDLKYAKWLFLTGRSDLPAPLCHIALSAEGVVYLGAAGRANHAGTAKASGSVAAGDGNSLYIGIEWMLSGTQKIADKQYDAAVKLNAVLLDVLGSSEQAVSCHYQISTTGKWDIGDPDGIEFNGHKVLDVKKFRRSVKELRTAGLRRDGHLKFAHISLQFSDSKSEQASDLKKIFGRGNDIVTGTEARKSKTYRVLKSEAKAAGMVVYRSSRSDCWIAVKKTLVEKGSFSSGYEHVIYSSAKRNDPAHPHGDRGVTWISFTSKDYGQISVAASHYLTLGRFEGQSQKDDRSCRDDHFTLNRKLADAIGDWARTFGGGAGLAFYGGDQNIVDRSQDTFFGNPLVSTWDELDKYQDTGHGNIDVIASYAADGRVSADYVRALDDKYVKLFGDHYLIESGFNVALLWT